VTTASIRRAEPDDLPAIAAIYAEYVERTVITFETAAPDAAGWRRRFDDVMARGLPFLVAVEAGDVVGYAYAGPWKDRAAYRYTAEDALYLAPGRRAEVSVERCSTPCWRRAPRPACAR
jgi:phosphinothricin acetyltransferase